MAKSGRFQGGGATNPETSSVSVPGIGIAGYFQLYVYYLTTPGEMDDDLETGFYLAAGTAGVAAAGAGLTAAVGAYGGAAVATAIGAEIADTAIEAGVSAATGRDVFIPTSPSDLIQDGASFLFKQGVKKAAKELGEKGVRGASFGGSGATGVVAPKGAIEMHHLLPKSKKFRSFFEGAGLDIEDFKIPLPKDAHRLKPNGIHTNGGGNWNKVWKKYIDEYPNASRSDILEQMKRMREQFGI